MDTNSSSLPSSPASTGSGILNRLFGGGGNSSLSTVGNSAHKSGEPVSESSSVNSLTGNTTLGSSGSSRLTSDMSTPSDPSPVVSSLSSSNGSTNSLVVPSPANAASAPPSPTKNSPLLSSHGQDSNIVVTNESLVKQLTALDRSRALWVGNNDAESTRCFLCQSKFTIILRQHHCRICGKVVCKRCSSVSVKLPSLSLRACSSCQRFLKFTDHSEAAVLLDPAVLIPSSAISSDSSKQSSAASSSSNSVGIASSASAESANRISTSDVNSMRDRESSQVPRNSHLSGASISSVEAPHSSDLSETSTEASKLEKIASAKPNYLTRPSTDSSSGNDSSPANRERNTNIRTAEEEEDEDEDSGSNSQKRDPSSSGLANTVYASGRVDEINGEVDRRFSLEDSYDGPLPPMLEENLGGVESAEEPILDEAVAAEQSFAVHGMVYMVVLECVLPAAMLSYAVYGLASLGKQQVRTPTVFMKPNDPSIRFGPQGFYFDVTSMKDTVQMSLWTLKNSQDADPDRVGEIEVPISSLDRNRTVERTLPIVLSDVNTTPRAASESRMRVSVHFAIAKTSVSVHDFELLRVVGRGNFGKVMQVRKKDTGSIYAMKVLRKDAVIQNDAVTHTMSERNVLRTLRHPFIVNLKYSFQTKEKLYMVMDYLSGGELFTHLSSVDCFSEDRARFYAGQIVLALGYMHSNHVIYRDLKPENILLDMDGNVCLTDFGLCKENIRHGERTRTFCGSPEYLAPETLRGRPYGAAVDWWALGTFLYEMLSGLPPYFDEDPRSMNRKILQAPLVFDPVLFSPEAQSLITNLLQRDPEKRLGSGPTDAAEIQSHPFFRTTDWDRMYGRQIIAPFRPHLRSEVDTKYFSEEFTSEAVRDSYVETHIPENMQEQFQGFTFVAPSEFLHKASPSPISSPSMASHSAESAEKRRGRWAAARSGSLSSSDGLSGATLSGGSNPSPSVPVRFIHSSEKSLLDE